MGHQKGCVPCWLQHTEGWKNQTSNPMDSFRDFWSTWDFGFRHLCTSSMAKQACVNNYPRSFWINEIPGYRHSKIFPHSNTNHVYLHVFADASERGFGAVGYVRFENDSGVVVSFVMANFRVTPLKLVMTPQLELYAEVMATRLAALIWQELHIAINDQSCIGSIRQGVSSIPMLGTASL